MRNKIIYLKDYSVPVFFVKKINLEFKLNDDCTTVQSEVLYYKNIDSKEKNDLEIFWEDLELISIILNEKELEQSKYVIWEWKITIKNTPGKFNLKIITKIYPEKNTTLMWLYKSGGKFCTQCESEGFRKITYYLDRPDVMSIFTTKIIADKIKYPILLSNGNKIEYWDLGNWKHFVIWEDPFKKPSYLFALVAWKLEYIEDTYKIKSWKEVILRLFTESHNISKCDFAIQSLKRAMKWDEDKFWLEYDLDLFMIVAVDDFNSWAMENKWLNIFNSKLVFATPESATDQDYIYIERVIGHEYFHNWTWDRVTCRDWFQLSLKEWLTVFRDSEFTADMHSRAVKRIEDVRYLRTHQFREDSSPIAHSIRPSFFEEISNFYTVTVYEKWAEVVRMYQTILWVEWFRKWMDLYFKRHDGEAVTTEDFLSAMWDANNKDLTQFNSWYNQAGTPVVEVISNYNKNTKIYTLTFTQTLQKTLNSTNKTPFIIPVKFWLINSNWNDITLDNDLIILTKDKEDFKFKNIEEGVTPSLFRGFSAPIKIKYDYSYDDYEFLMKNDSDSFNRFEASQNFAKDIILDLYFNKENEINIGFINSLKNILENDKLSNSFKSEVLTLPSEIEIFDIIWIEVKPNKIHKIREYFIKTIATNLKDTLYIIYNNLNVIKKYNVNSTDIWDRKLKNTALFYLWYTFWAEIAYNQYKKSNNMTDTISSLICLSNMECTEKNNALEDFYKKWENNPNVIDKRFNTQAVSSLENTLENIKKLSNHKLFDINNPNKVRALFNSFTMLNPVIFHKENWGSYEFIADKVIELDKINPMIASRLAKNLINWKQLELSLWNKLKFQLIRISKIDNISKDLNEVVNKALV